MPSRVIFRLVYKRVEDQGVKTVEYTGLEGRESWEIREYMVEPEYLIIQRLDQPDAYRVEARELGFAPLPWRSYCRWHNAPLWEKDEPWRRLYCVVESDSYCRQHRRSPRALYEACTSTQSLRDLELCRRIDELGRTEYVVYLTDAGAGRVKVGITRGFRVEERLAEQAHNVATILHTVDSLYEARRMELEISRRHLASQVKSKKPREVSLPLAAATLASTAEKIASAMGVEWSGELFRVVSSVEHVVLGSREAGPEELAGKAFNLAGYWGGHLVLEDESGSSLHVSDKRLLHRDSLLIEE